MKRKRIIIIVCLAVAAVLAAAVGYVVYYKSGRGSFFPNEYPTDGYMEAETPHADPLMTGRWQNTANPGWYKVYYDDYDEETQLFWGKEWNEADSVLEDDLKYHGNGWFRWEKKGKKLHEYATMDYTDVPIHRAYKIRLSTSDSLVYFEPDYKKTVYRFGRVR